MINNKVTCCQDTRCGWDGPNEDSGSCFTVEIDETGVPGGRPNICDGACGSYQMESECCGKTGINNISCQWDGNQCYHYGCCDGRPTNFSP